MMKKSTFRAIILVIFVSLIVVLFFTSSARADLAVSEASLAQGGQAYEINPDSQGVLWISDSTVGEIWGVNPSSGEYQVFPVGGSPVDARQSGGWLWWANVFANSLGRVSTEDGSYIKWQVPDITGFLGTNLDADGRFYATDSFNPYLYRLAPDSVDPNLAELCTFTLPVPSSSIYIARDGDYLWVGDGYDSTILRLQVSNNTVTAWQLPLGSFPRGLAVDGQGNLWYADDGLEAIGMLNPSTNGVRLFSLLRGDSLNMLAIQAGKIWYTEQGIPSTGQLDPQIASFTTETLIPTTTELVPDCTQITSSDSGTMTIGSGSLSWADGNYPVYQISSGWRIYQMPEGATPWGITLPNLGYVVDYGRQKLARFSTSLPPALIVKKVVVNDNGGTLAPSDFSFSVNGGEPIAFNSDGQNGIEVSPGTIYDITELPVAGYATTYDHCSNIILPGGVGATATCTITNDDQETNIMVTKVVQNTHGGTALPDDFDLTLGGSPVTSGVAVPVVPGTYTVGETLLKGYTFNGFSGDCDSNGEIRVALGESKTCTLTNSDQQAFITVTKVVQNTHGGTARPDDFDLTLEGSPVTSGVAVPVLPGSYTAGETLLPGYAFDGFSGDCDSNGEITLAVGESKTCTLTNSDQQAFVIVTKVVHNTHGGTALPDDFDLTLGGSPVNSGALVPVVPGTYTAGETLLPGYAFDGFSGDCNLNGEVSLALGEGKTCTLTNSDLPPSESKFYLPFVSR